MLLLAVRFSRSEAGRWIAVQGCDNGLDRVRRQGIEAISCPQASPPASRVMMALQGQSHTTGLRHDGEAGGCFVRLNRDGLLTGGNLLLQRRYDRFEDRLGSLFNCLRVLATAQRIDELHKVPVISIVDDDESIRVAAESLVRSLGFRAYTFASADEFLKSPCLIDTACVISDVQMPNMTGIELQDRLIARGCRVPMIFITAYPDESVRARAMDAGAVCFLNKPFDLKTLIGCIGEALQKSDGSKDG